ncbi:MAG: TonB family protein [Myxococcales bacterium]|nr:TonB family protein [Myxococcales bacterium]
MTERLGRYVVLKHLASGGMADVLLARTDGIEGFERHVVLKRIRAEHAKDQRFIDMFLDEARLAANLHHQNVVQVHDIGESSGEYFFAMEYLHGEDLRTILSTIAKTRTHVPLPLVLSIVCSVAAGLHYAHERKGPDKKPLNIVHRDVSPSNILVGYDGSVKVVDFGIAKAAMRQVETRSGSLKGKVSYMSPEQCKMGAIDRRSDVYALGVVLYELATTTRLFKSDSDYLVMDAICTGKIPLPRVRRPDLPNELSTIIMTALATDPERRYQTAEELRVALDQFAAKQGLTANAGAIATYVTKTFGERPEPWLDVTGGEPKGGGAADTVANGDLGRRSWSDLPVARTRTGGGADEAKTITDGKGKRPTTAPAIAAAVARTESEPRVDERTSTRMAWEHEGSLPPPPSSPAQRFPVQKIAMIAVPVVLLVGLGIWKLTGGGKDSDKPADKVASSATEVSSSAPGTGAPGPAQDKTVAPDTTHVAKVEPAHAVANTEPAKTEPAKTEPAKAVVTKTEPAKTEPAKAVVTKTEPAKTEPAKTEPAKAVVAKTEPAKTEPPKVTPAKTEPVKAVVAKTEPAKTEPPKVTPAKVEPAVVTPPVTPPPPVVAPQVARLSQGSIDGVASQHRGELSKCEGTDELHGEVSVKFEVNAAGRVVKSQVASSLKNSRVSGCILRTVQGWQFPKPPSGAAEGTYTMSYQ